MDNLKIAPTDFTPGVDFNLDSLNFRLWGISRPEDVRNFYDQIVGWLTELEKYLSKTVHKDADAGKIHMEFRLAYFNSSSSKLIIEILNHLKRFKTFGFELEVAWYYDAGDEQMYDDAEELAEACELDFKYYEVS